MEKIEKFYKGFKPSWGNFWVVLSLRFQIFPRGLEPSWLRPCLKVINFTNDPQPQELPILENKKHFFPNISENHDHIKDHRQQHWKIYLFIFFFIFAFIFRDLQTTRDCIFSSHDEHHRELHSVLMYNHFIL